MTQASALICFWHHVVEEVSPNSFLQCPTCKHVYQSEALFRKEAFDLETPEYDDNGKEVEGFSKKIWPEGTKVEDVNWCPLCGGHIEYSAPAPSSSE